MHTLASKQTLMIRYLPIKTGSWGNCIYLDFNGEQRTILDAGVDITIVQDALRPYHADKYWVNHFTSHKHGDHIKYLEQYRNRFSIKNSKVTAYMFKLPHSEDTDSRAWVIEYENYRVLWMTDFKYVTQELKEFVKDSYFDLVLIEANYSSALLLDRYAAGEIKGKGHSWGNHHSIENTMLFLSTFKWAQVELIHISRSNSSLETLRLLKASKSYVGNIDFVSPNRKAPIHKKMKYVYPSDTHKTILHSLGDSPPWGFDESL